MRKIICISILSLLLTNCKSSIKKVYYSNCILYGKPEYKLIMKDSLNFEFISSFNDSIKGRWKINKDTLILESNSFLKSDLFDINKDSILKNVKYTVYEKQEKYLIKKKRLFLINKNGIDENCYLLAGKR